MLLLLLLVYSSRVRGHLAPAAGDDRRTPTCPKWQVEASPRESGHQPWTHAPYCTSSGRAGGPDSLCVYTDANFHFGQGISIVAQPETAEQLVKQRLLQDPQNEPRTAGPAAGYEAVSTPDAGVGLFVKPSRHYAAGDVVLVDYPTLVMPSGGFDTIPSHILSDMRWRALLQLPTRARSRTRSLAQSKGAYTDEIVDIFDTNAFTHEKGGSVHDIIFAEASVSYLGISMSQKERKANTNATVSESTIAVGQSELPTLAYPSVHSGALLTGDSTITRTNQSTLAMEVVALHDIGAGEEIFISYLDPSMETTSAQRLERLRSEWSFSCRCPICAGDGVAASDRRRRDIANAKQRLGAAKGNALEVLRAAQALIDLVTQEGMVIPMAEYSELAAHASKHLGRRNEALEFARLAKRHWDVVFGSDSAESKQIERFVQGLGLKR